MKEVFELKEISLEEYTELQKEISELSIKIVEVMHGRKSYVQIAVLEYAKQLLQAGFGKSGDQSISGIQSLFSRLSNPKTATEKKSPSWVAEELGS